MQKQLVVFLMLFILFMTSMSYTQELKKNENGNYDDLSNYLIVKPFIAFNATDYIIFHNDANGKPETLTYHTLEKEIDGLSLTFGAFGFSVGIGRITAEEYESYEDKNELSYDFRLNYLGRRICFDLYYQKQNGLFLDSVDGKNSDGTLFFFNTMDFMILSANLYYIFSWESFSLMAAYESVDVQKKSAGSFLLMMNSGVITLKDDSPILRDDINSVEDKMKGLSEIKSEYISLAPGYSRTIIFFDNFFFNFLIFCGVGADQTVYFTDSGNLTKYKIYPRVNLKFALGYSDERFFCGANVNIDEQTSSMNNHSSSMNKDLDTSLLLYDSKFYAGYRFSI